MQRLKSAYEKLSKQKKAVATEWKALEKEQKELKEERRLHEQLVQDTWHIARPSVSDADLEKRYKLNVGGQPFECTAKVLCRDGLSLLAAITMDDSPIQPGPGGSYFFDRDWWIFRHVLRYLRDGALPERVDILQDLHREACFFRMAALKNAIEGRLGRRLVVGGWELWGGWGGWGGGGGGREGGRARNSRASFSLPAPAPLPLPPPPPHPPPLLPPRLTQRSRERSGNRAAWKGRRVVRRIRIHGSQRLQPERLSSRPPRALREEDRRRQAAAARGGEGLRLRPRPLLRRGDGSRAQGGGRPRALVVGRGRPEGEEERARRRWRRWQEEGAEQSRPGPEGPARLYARAETGARVCVQDGCALDWNR